MNDQPIIQGALLVKVVEKVIDSQKTFDKRTGSFRKWFIHFADGFVAENVIPNDGSRPKFKPGDTCEFRVGYVSSKGTEIDFRESRSGDNNPDPFSSTPEVEEKVKPLHNVSHDYRLANLSGSPIAVALHASVKMGNSAPEDVINDAEILLAWILKKVEGKE